MRLKKYPLPAPGSLRFRKTLSIPSPLDHVRDEFNQLPEHRSKGIRYPLPDALMSAVAMFSLKDETLFAFDELRQDPVRQHNLQQLYGIAQAPCDTQLRSILDQVKPHSLRPAFRSIHQAFPRMEMIALQDALACNGPRIKTLQANCFSFIITAKPQSNRLLLKTVLEGYGLTMRRMIDRFSNVLKGK